MIRIHPYKVKCGFCGKAFITSVAGADYDRINQGEFKCPDCKENQYPIVRRQKYELSIVPS